MENCFSVDKHLCAGGEKGKDSCKVNYNLKLISILTLTDRFIKGDSGGPLIAQKSTLDPFMLVGIVSGGTSRFGQRVSSFIVIWLIFQMWCRSTWYFHQSDRLS